MIKTMSKIIGFKVMFIEKRKRKKIKQVYRKNFTTRLIIIEELRTLI